MREIKFRYRYTDGQNWIMKVFDLPQIANGEPFEVLSDQPLLRNYKHVGEDEYAGLKDKNGKEIFEGDIVISDFGTKRPTEIKYGEFHDFTHADDSTTNVGFYWNEISGEISPLGKSIHGNMNYCEVVGNIYENPELLTQSFAKVNN